MKNTCNAGQIILYAGVVLGNAEWVLTLIYLASNKWESDVTRTACVIFLLAQPIFYWFMYTLYILNHPDIKDNSERFKKLALGPLYAFLQQVKCLSAFDTIYHRFEDLFSMREPFHLLTVENCFKV